METNDDKRLSFMACLLGADADELGRINAAIRAAWRLPTGADAVIAEGINNPEIAAMLERYERKRREGWKTPQGTKHAAGVPPEPPKPKTPPKHPRKEKAEKNTHIHTTPLDFCGSGDILETFRGKPKQGLISFRE